MEITIGGQKTNGNAHKLLKYIVYSLLPLRMREVKTDFLSMNLCTDVLATPTATSVFRSACEGEAATGTDSITPLNSHSFILQQRRTVYLISYCLM